MAPKDFADALKEARTKAGLSQAALARRAGLTGSYVSVLESRRRPPPSPRVIRSLCRAMGVDPAPFLEAAALERSPPTVRRRLERMRKEHGKAERTRDRLLTTTLFHLSRKPRVVEPMAEFLDLPTGQQALLRRLLGRLRRVRSIDEAETSSSKILDEATPDDREALVRVLPRALSASPDDAEGADGAGEVETAEPEPPPPVEATAPVRVDLRAGAEEAGRRPVDAGLWHEDLFFWRVKGDHAHPRFEAGDIVLVDPRLDAKEGDHVVLRHEDRDVIGTCQRRGDEMHVVFPRPEVPPLRIPFAEFRPAGVVIRLERELR